MLLVCGGSVIWLLAGTEDIHLLQVGYGEWVRFHQKMPVWAPPVPSREVFPTEIEHTKDQVSER